MGTIAGGGAMTKVPPGSGREGGPVATREWEKRDPVHCKRIQMSLRPFMPTILLALPAMLSMPVRAQAPGGQLDASPALFSVLAAINAAGYDAELASPNCHPLRAAVRKWIEARNPKSLPRLRKFVEAHRQANATAELGQYVSYALSVDGPPSFKPRYSPAQMPPDTVALTGLSEILADFHQEAALDEAWRQAQPAIEQMIGTYHSQVLQAVFDANAYLRNPTSGSRGRRFQIYLDVLAAPNQVHSRSFGDDYFVVVTPSPEPRVRDIRHAYLDYLIDPLAIRNAVALDKKKGLGDLAQGSPLLAEDYKSDFTRLAGMCVVRAVEARLDRQAGQASVDESMKEGFILTAYFYEALGGYEKQEQAFRLYFPSMIDAIDLAKEDKRIARVEFVSQRAVKTVKVAPPKEPELSGPAKLAADAEKLYDARNLPAAKESYRLLLTQNAGRTLQAKAYFGLARIAALEKQPEESQQFFERVLELEPEPFERAWSHVYLARLARAAQEPEAALKHYQEALAVKDASEGALKAAQAEMPAVAASLKPSPQQP
jgi:tetratricopeptide (TPR) repeat protein